MEREILKGIRVFGVVFFVSLLSCFEVRAGFPEPGTFECYSPTVPDAPDLEGSQAKPLGQENATSKDDPPFLRGFCRYQAIADHGEASFSNLLVLAKLLVQPWIEGIGHDPNTLEPRSEPGFRILWWFDSSRWNQALGHFLIENDRPQRVFPRTHVEITVRLYSAKSGFERDFGVEFGAFYGNRELEQEPADYLGSVMGGIFSSAVGIGNPLASFLDFTVRSTNNKKQSEIRDVVVYECVAGDDCTYSHLATRYYQHPTGVKPEQVGLRVFARPHVDPVDPNLVKLEHFDLRWALPLEDPDMPVDVMHPFNHRSIVVRADHLYVIGSESRRYDVKTGRILGSANESGHTKTLILLSVRVKSKLGQKKASYGFRYQKPVTTLTPEEVSQLPSGELSFKEILNSLDLACYDDLVNTARAEKICGFHFRSMDQEHHRKRLQFSLKGVKRGFGSRSPKLVHPDRAVTHRMAGSVFQGKGYYQIPRLAAKEPARYRLRIDLHDLSKSQRKRKSEDVKGVEFDFVYYPGDPSPIEWDFSEKKWVK